MFSKWIEAAWFIISKQIYKQQSYLRKYRKKLHLMIQCRIFFSSYKQSRRQVWYWQSRAPSRCWRGQRSTPGAGLTATLPLGNLYRRGKWWGLTCDSLAGTTAQTTGPKQHREQYEPRTKRNPHHQHRAPGSRHLLTPWRQRRRGLTYTTHPRNR